MSYLCGKEILLRILNFHDYMSEVKVNKLIDYIKGIGLTEEEENSLSEIINDNRIIERILIKKIAFLSNPRNQYSYGINENIRIIPSFNGENCKFSVNPPFPGGIELDKESGIINGKVNKEIKNENYTITCYNITSKKIFNMWIEFSIKFGVINQNRGITLSNDGKLITKTSGDNYYHAYLNLTIEKGIYRIKYKFSKNSAENDSVMLGLSTINTYFGNDIYNRSTTCNYYAWDGRSQDVTKYCHIGKVVNNHPNFNDHGDGSKYEMIVDMNKREFWISHNNSSPVLLVKDLPSPLYPFVALHYKNTSVKLLSVYYED